MNTTVTDGQITGFLKLLKDKRMTPERWQKIIASGHLADILDPAADLRDREMFRSNLGLGLQSLEIHYNGISNSTRMIEAIDQKGSMFVTARAEKILHTINTTLASEESWPGSVRRLIHIVVPSSLSGGDLFQSAFKIGLARPTIMMALQLRLTYSSKELGCKNVVVCHEPVRFEGDDYLFKLSWNPEEADEQGCDLLDVQKLKHPNFGYYGYLGEPGTYKLAFVEPMNPEEPWKG